MPNLNATYQEAITAICAGKHATKKDMKVAFDIFSSVGECIELKENHLAAFSAIAGASPAYTFMYIDALALAAVKAGIPRDKAMHIATQAVKGSAIMLEKSGMHPDALRDRV